MISSAHSFTRIQLRWLALLATVLAAAAISLAGARAASAAKLPVIYKVDPRENVNIGDKLTLTGKNFVVGKKTMLIMFKRVGSKRRFTTRAVVTSKRSATVVVPDLSGDLIRATPGHNPLPADNMYRLRAVTKFGASKAWTNSAISPMMNPNSTAPNNQDTGPNGDCDNDGQINSIDTDDDNDLLPDVTENSIGTNACVSDSDNDGVSDYYEYRVAYEFNGGPTLPYPGKAPYPNPLVVDSDIDYDGDHLSQLEEYKAWQYTGRMDRFYSDANQDSDGDGIRDGAEDEDGDQLPNLVELRYFGPPKPLNWLDNDTDGDGLCDGLDDQDHDGAPTPLAQADCTTHVPNNGPSGTPPSPSGAGDPNGALIDADDNIYSNYYEWVINRPNVDAGAAYDPCDPSPYPTSPTCNDPYSFPYP